MKKLVIAAAIALAAVASQAAAISWGTAGIKDHTGTNASKSSATITAICTIWDSTGNTVLYTSDPTSYNSLNQYKGTWTDETLVKAGTTYQAQIVLTSSDGWELKSDVASFTTDASDPYNINFSSGAGFISETAKLNNASTTANYGWQSVPEPTSGLLLLLGVAGLALKRKRA